MAFIGGVSTMSLQMVSVRIVSPWLGASSVVWAAMISMSLIGMAFGYLVGGYVADRSPKLKVLAVIHFFSFILIALIPLFSSYFLRLIIVNSSTSDIALMFKAFLATSIFALPASILLGTTATFIIRVLANDVNYSGRIAGKIYAISTTGSIIGTSLTALFLIQAIGSTFTCYLISILLLISSVIGLISPHKNDIETQDRGEVPEFQYKPSISLIFAALILAIEGSATMTTELGIMRLIAPFFGASMIVWANVITIIMACIAIGSWLGGKLADKRPSVTYLITLLSLASIFLTLLPFISIPILHLTIGALETASVGVILGSFFSILCIVVLPITILGAIPPLLIRLSTSNIRKSGITAGISYASSTLGALLGTLISSLWLLPLAGTRRTFLLASALLALTALILSIRYLKQQLTIRTVIAVMPLLIVLIALLIPLGVIKPSNDVKVVQERETRYQFAQVVEDKNYTRQRFLQLNEGWAVHSVWSKDTVITGGIWDHFLVLPDLLPKDVSQKNPKFLIVGNAGGTGARAFAKLRPNVQVDGVEIDPQITELGKRWFGLPKSEKVFTADGRLFLRANENKHWDIIHVDAYRQPYIPFYLTTKEFFSLAKSRLTNDGVLSINVGLTPKDDRIVRYIASTMREVFPLVIQYRAERYNDLVIGISDKSLTIKDLRKRLDQAPSLSDLPDLQSDLSTGMQVVSPDKSRILTDDLAPVEWMTDRMILREAK